LTRNSNEILEYDVAVPTIDEGEDEEEFVNLGMKKILKPYNCLNFINYEFEISY
jgi:hypothetical protein